MQTSRSEFIEKPKLHDLFTINLDDGDLWYKLGVELGISSVDLDAIRTKYVKAQRCKREMFKLWLNSGRSCTWSRLVNALRKLDAKVAESVHQTIMSEMKQSAQSSGGRLHTAQFPIIPGGRRQDRERQSPLSRSLTPSSSRAGSAPVSPKPHTDIVRVNTPSPSSSFESIPTKPKKPSEVSVEVKSKEVGGASETASAGTDAFQTASEDESSLLSSSSRQQTAAATGSVSRDQVQVMFSD